jgi:hypothetical protein
MYKLSSDDLETIARLAVKQHASYDELLNKLAEVCKDLSNQDIDCVLAQIRTAMMGQSDNEASLMHYNTLLHVQEIEELLQDLAVQLRDDKLVQCPLAILDEASLDADKRKLKIRYDKEKIGLNEIKSSREYQNALQYRKGQMKCVRNKAVKQRILELYASTSKEGKEGNESENSDDSENEEDDDAITALLKELDEEVAQAGSDNLGSVEKSVSAPHSEQSPIAKEAPSARELDPLQKLGKLGSKAKKNIQVTQIVRNLRKQKEALQKQLDELTAAKSPTKKKSPVVKAVGNPGRRIANGCNKRTKNEEYAYLYLAIFGPFLDIFKLGMSKNKVYELIRHYSRCLGPCALLWRVRILAKDSINMARGIYISYLICYSHLNNADA